MQSAPKYHARPQEYHKLAHEKHMQSEAKLGWQHTPEPKCRCTTFYQASNPKAQAELRTPFLRGQTSRACNLRKPSWSIHVSIPNNKDPAL